MTLTDTQQKELHDLCSEYATEDFSLNSAKCFNIIVSKWCVKNNFGLLFPTDWHTKRVHIKFCIFSADYGSGTLDYKFDTVKELRKKKITSIFS